MPNPVRLVGLILAGLSIAMTAERAASTFAEPPGLIIVKVYPDSSAAKAGLKDGDRLLSYDGRPLASVAALQAARQNIVDKKEVPLRVRRGNETLTLTLIVPMGGLGIDVLPDLPADAVALDTEAQRAQKPQEVDEIISKWGSMAKSVSERGDKAAATHLYERLGSFYEGRKKWKDAQDAYATGWKLAQANGDPAIQARMLEGLARCSQSLNDYPAARRWYVQASQVNTAASNEMWVAGNLTDLGNVAQSQGEFPAATGYYLRAFKMLERLVPNTLSVARSLNNLGAVAFLMGDLVAAQNYTRLALVISERIAPNSLDVAKSLIHFGNVASARADVKTAQSSYDRALKIFERLDPKSEGMAATLTGLGDVASVRGDLPGAQNWYRQALALNPPGSLDAAGNLHNMGNVAFLLGDLRTAEAYYRDALAIREHLAPDTIDVAATRAGLGSVALSRGDLQTAESHYRAALAINMRARPNSGAVAGNLNNLGNVAQVRGDLQAAGDYYGRSVEIKKEKLPGTRELAGGLNNQGNIDFLSGDLAKARVHYQDALTIKQKIAPDSLDVAITLNNLGNVSLASGDPQAAEDYAGQAVTICERLASNSLDMAISLNNLGNVKRVRGDLRAAEDNYKRALAIQVRLAPDSLDVASSLNNLGYLALGQEHLPEALAHFSSAVDIVEAQRRQILFPDSRALFVQEHGNEFTGLLLAHLALNDGTAAFAVVERARARGLVELMAERNIDFRSDGSTKFLNLRQQQEELDRDRSSAYYALRTVSLELEAAGAGLKELDQEEFQQIDRLKKRMDELKKEIKKQQGQLAKLSIQQRELGARIRNEFPGYASLRYPTPLNLKGAQDALDPGTLLLTYFITDNETWLFAVTKTDLKIVKLPLGEKALKAQVQNFYDEVGNFRPVMTARLQDATTQGRQLYDALIGPVGPLVSKAERILICPDGLLHVLPFGALVSQTEPSLRYFIEDRPLHTIVSMTVYEKARQMALEHARPGSKRVMAFGDPVYSAKQRGRMAAKGRTPKKSLQEAGVRKKEAGNDEGEAAEFRLPRKPMDPLPGARKEVLAIKQMFGNLATVRLGAQATETAAKQVSESYAILHFGVHGFLYEQSGLDSALALSQPRALGREATKQDNGYLQAWEIFEQVKLKADLVVLSACDIGLGERIRGEGLIGLTRAFQYAGARSIVVSLWEASDESTAELMTAFYRELRSGASKDVALQRATAVVRNSRIKTRWRHPYYWAPFLLTGDWQ